MYSMEDQYTLQSLSDWIRECVDMNEAPDNILWILVGNKNDLENEVEPSSVEAFCKEHDITHLYFISAKSGKKVDEMLHSVLKAALENHDNMSSTVITEIVNVGVTTTHRNRGKCNC